MNCEHFGRPNTMPGGVSRQLGPYQIGGDCGYRTFISGKPPESVMIVNIAKELQKCGSVGKPNWVPGTGLKSTPHESVHGCC